VCFFGFLCFISLWFFFSFLFGGGGSADCGADCGGMAGCLQRCLYFLLVWDCGGGNPGDCGGHSRAACRADMSLVVVLLIAAYFRPGRRFIVCHCRPFCWSSPPLWVSPISPSRRRRSPSFAFSAPLLMLFPFLLFLFASRSSEALRRPLSS
jgi:hypothetical protein